MTRESYLLGCIRRSREYEEAIVMADQCVSTLNPVVPGNTYAFIAQCQRGIRDIQEVTGIMGLTPEQAQPLNKLEPGEGIISKAARYPHPQLITFPLIEPKYLTDEDIDRINSQDKILQNLLKKIKPVKEKPKPILNQRQHTDIKKFLWEVNRYQYIYSKTEIAKKAGFKLGGRSQRIADYCEKHNLIKMLKPNIGKGSAQYPIMTPEGYEILEEPERHYFSKGAGPLHIWGVHQIWKHLSIFKPGFELFRGGKHIDITIETDEHLIAFEMERTSAHIEENIRKDFENAKATFLFVVCWDGRVLKAAYSIISEMPEDIQNKIQAYTLSEFLKKNPDELINHIIEGRISD